MSAPPGPVTAGAGETVVDHVACLGCGCVCDDVRVTARGGRIVRVERACDLGVAWFGDGSLPARVQVAGVDVPLDAALDEIARLLAEARRPLVYLAPQLSCEAQRAAIAVADVARAALDSVTSAMTLAPVLAAQERGVVSASLGEVRHRADVIVCWRVDPSRRYPRYAERYGPDAAGAWVPDGRRSRTVVAVDVGDARGPADADHRITVDAADEIAVLTAAAAIAADPASAPESEASNPGVAAGGTTPDATAWGLARALVDRVRGGRYVVVVSDAEPADVPSGGGDAFALARARAGALLGLVQALTATVRCGLSPLRAGGNRSGADAGMTAQTGYPCAVDFATGVPRYRPYDGRADVLLGRQEIDAALVVGAWPDVPAAVREHLARVPHAVVGPAATAHAGDGCRVAIDTGRAGVHEPGTALRMDDVPLPLSSCLESAAADTAAVLRALAVRSAGARRAGARA